MKSNVPKDCVMEMMVMINYAWEAMSCETMEESEKMAKIRNGLLSGEMIEWEEE